MLPAVLHAAVIFLLNKAARRDCPRLPEIALLLLHQAYRHVAEALTDLENHRTQEGLLRDPARSCEILRDSPRSCEILRDSLSSSELL